MSQYVHPDVLVDSQWLMDHLAAPTVRVVVEVEMSPEPYKNAHIPGAVFWNILTDTKMAPSNQWKHCRHFSAASSQGVTADKDVFPYCAIGGRSAYIWFVLKYLLGYPEVRNYDGSWNEWSRLSNSLIEQ